MKKLAICVPWSTPFIWKHPAFNLMNLERPPGVEVRYISGDGWCPASRHNNCCVRALNWGADHILFLGADQVHGEDTIIKLKSHLPKWDMSTGMVPSRGSCGPELRPFAGIAYKIKNRAILPRFFPILQFNESAWEILDHTAEPQEIHVIGTGVLLMKAEILHGMKQPWFQEFILRDDVYSRAPVQDTHFVYRCTVESGARLFLDTTVEAYHLDLFPIDFTYTDRFSEHTGDQYWTPMRDVGINESEKSESPSHNLQQPRVVAK